MYFMVFFISLIAILSYILFIKLKKNQKQCIDNDLLNINFEQKNLINQTESQSLNFSNYCKKNINLKDGVKLIFEHFFYNNQNHTFLLDFDENFDENFDYSYKRIMDLIYLTMNFLCKNINYANISTNFSSQQRLENDIINTIEIDVNKPIKDNNLINQLKEISNKTPKDETLKSIQSILKDLNISCNCQLDEKMIISFKFISKKNTINGQKEKYNYSDKNILICCEDDAITKNLVTIVKNFNINIVPKHTWETTKSYILDAVFIPHIIFISAKILKDKQKVQFLNEFVNFKNITIVIFFSNSTQYKDIIGVNFNFIEINLPCLKEEIEVILSEKFINNSFL